MIFMNTILLLQTFKAQVLHALNANELWVNIFMNHTFLSNPGYSNSILSLLYIFLLYSWLIAVDCSIKYFFHFLGFLNCLNQIIVLSNLIETGVRKNLSALWAFNLRLILSVYFVNACFTDRVSTCQDHRQLRLILGEILAADWASEELYIFHLLLYLFFYLPN